MRYVTKPVEIEAIQFTGNVNEIIEFTNTNDVDASFKEGRWTCTINTPLVRLVVLETDYVIKMETNELSVMKADMFERLYEPKVRSK